MDHQLASPTVPGLGEDGVAVAVAGYGVLVGIGVKVAVGVRVGVSVAVGVSVGRSS
jgi:hypothetical protein